MRHKWTNVESWGRALGVGVVQSARCLKCGCIKERMAGSMDGRTSTYNPSGVWWYMTVHGVRSKQLPECVPMED